MGPELGGEGGQLAGGAALHAQGEQDAADLRVRRLAAEEEAHQLPRPLGLEVAPLHKGEHEFRESHG